MAEYLVTIEVRLRVTAANPTDAKLNASVGILDGESGERLGVEWLGQDVVSCEEDRDA